MRTTQRSEIESLQLAKRTQTSLVLMDRGSGYSAENNSPPRGSAWIFLDLSAADAESVAESLLKIEGVVMPTQLMVPVT